MHQKLANLSFSNVLKYLAKEDAVVSPTSGMPNELMNISKVGDLEASILSKRLSIDFSPNPSRLFNSLSYFFSLKRSATSFTYLS